MSKNYFRVETFLKMPEEVRVKFRKGLFLILMTAGAETAVASDYEGVMQDSDGPVSEITLQDSGARLSFSSNHVSTETEWIFQTADDLKESLMMHRGETLSPEDMREFEYIASQLPAIGIKESMVTYEQEDRQISYHLLTKDGMVAHLSQYFNPPKDQIVYSVEQGDNLLVAGHAPTEGFGEYLAEVLTKCSQKV